MDSLTTHTDYGSTSLESADLDPNPLRAFAAWLQAAEDAGVYEPNAMVVGTVDAQGAPSSRTVLLKGLDDSGFEFVTNYSSRKGGEIAGNPAVSLLFPWYSLNRQVCVRGTAAPTAAAASDAYFARRPRGARLAALASEQSRPIDDRATLVSRVAELEVRYPEGVEIPRPAHWGGMRVEPVSVEFWQGRTSRMHDRIRYLCDPAAATGWQVERLQP
ncbi:MAG: pyridoxamine 5'-phosphate oxidase [Burkholderiaceae bacterium]|nr:pyridoxamine 5'-phosphate oxidase [Microbacteriaceae bacterium]